MLSIELADLIAFNLALLVAIASPGPAFLYLLKATMTGSRASALATGCGLGAAAAFYTLLALLGLDALFTLVPWAYAAIKTAGAIYLLYIAWNIWRSARKPLEAAEAPRGRSFMAGAMVNLANPKSVLFAAAVIAVVFPANLSGADKALIAFNHVAVEWIVYGTFVAVMGSRPVRRRYLAAKTVLDRVAAGLLGALGIRLLADR